MGDLINDLEIVKRRIKRLNGFGEEAEIVGEAIAMLEEKKPSPNRLLTLEEAQIAVGHGWEEIWFHAEDGMPECLILSECVFIHGYLRHADGDVSDVCPRNYNKPYHSRLWMGDEPPTDEQMKATPWKD